MTLRINDNIMEQIMRLQKFPTVFKRILNVTMGMSLDVLHENIPPYPAPPQNSGYTRTGQLGRSLGSSDGGGRSGPPDIKEVKLGADYVTGTFGTNLEYAQFPIGDQQAWMHKGRWWKLSDALKKAETKIVILWERAAKEGADWIKGIAG